MGNTPENTNEKKNLGKAKSFNNGPVLKSRNEMAKRKSFSLNEAVMSLDLALGRLKKSKLVPGEEGGARAAPGGRCAPADMFMDLSSGSTTVNPATSIANTSLMSMNFSHYELMRNLSRSNSTSEGAFSGTTCNTYRVDSSLKNEHLEKYFRSVDLWYRKHQHHESSGGPSVHFELPEK